jgi:hypothetical protein
VPQKRIEINYIIIYYYVAPKIGGSYYWSILKVWQYYYGIFLIRIVTLQDFIFAFLRQNLELFSFEEGFKGSTRFSGYLN